MRAAVFQDSSAGQSPQQRLDCLATWLKKEDVDLVLCSELFMSGYAIGDALPQYLEASDGSFALAVSSVARQFNTAIVYGYPEAAGGCAYNAAQCIDRAGNRLANHRKLVLPPGSEADYFSPGEGLTSFESGGFRFALAICYDAEFPETIRAAALEGVQVLLIPTALRDKWDVVAHRVIPARAFENGIYVLYANHAGVEGGVEYLGASCIVGPDGIDLVRAGSDEAFISATLDASQVEKAQVRLPYLDDLALLKQRLGKQVSG